MSSLTIHNRLVISMILPTKGDVITLKAVSDLRNKVIPTMEEFAAVNGKRDESGLHWDSSLDSPIEVNITSTEKQIIVDALKELNASKSLTSDHLPLWDKFVE